MAGIKYVVGDATLPQGLDRRFIIHICNNVGAWGAGFVMALRKQWPRAEAQYHAWYNAGPKIPYPLRLGHVQFVKVDEDLAVGNMIAQDGIGRHPTKPPIRYDALIDCLIVVREKAQKWNASVHLPRIGAGLAGGNWTIIEQLLLQELVAHGISVTVYDLAATQPTVTIEHVS
jgi:O-acetyl-ADP-ribose deacetylase (regulator of RNase III)